MLNTQVGLKGDHDQVLFGSSQTFQFQLAFISKKYRDFLHTKDLLVTNIV